jgi:RNA polymerase sigma factor (sigma-70 family)
VPDEELVARVRGGDAAAFEAVYDRYHRPLLGFCRHMLSSQPEAEDALQHVFIAAHRTLRGDERPIQLKPWLYAVAGNRCRSVLRARREHVPLDAVREPATAGLAMAEEVERREDLKHLLADVAGLPEDQRAALVLAELGDLSHDEIAATLGVRTDKVKALVFQARESLIGTRRARETDCTEIRAQLATLRGGALRRTSITRHLAACPTCAAFKAEVRAQRAALGCVLPVVPALALKQGVLAAVLAGGSGGAAAAGLAVTGAGTTGAAAAGSGLAGTAGTAAAGGGMASTAGSAATASSAAIAAAGSVGAATKVLVALALTGGAVGGGVAIEQRERPKAPRVERAPARAAPSDTAVPFRTDPAQARPGGPAGPSGTGGAPGSSTVEVRPKAVPGRAGAGGATPRPKAALDKGAARGSGTPSRSPAGTGRPARAKPQRAVSPGRAPANRPKPPAAPERITRPKPSARPPAKAPKPSAAPAAETPSPPKAEGDKPVRRPQPAPAAEDASKGPTP